MTTEYWALAPSSEIAHEINGKWSEHLTWLDSTGYGAMVQTMYDLYYGLKDGGFSLFISDDGSTAKISVNHFKSLIERSASLATQAKLQYVPRARNSDASSQMQADLARGLLEFYADEKGMDSVTSQMVQTGLVCLDSFVYAPWDEHQGEVIAKGDGLQELRNGDQAFYLLTGFDVARHQTLADTPWYIVKLAVNKYDLAALYPKHREEILAMSASQSSALSNSYLQTPFNREDAVADDVVYVYHMLHDRTPSLPKGRHTLVVGSTVLKDTALPYKTLPVVPFCGSRMLQTNTGDSPGTSLVGIQQTIDNIYSSNVTNNLHFNKQSLWSPTDIDIKPLSTGYQLVIAPQPPQAIQLTASSPESYKLLQGLEGQMQTLSGVNATTRGNPEASLKSGNSLALMLSVAVMSVNDIQKNYAKAAAQLGTIVIHNIQQFATEERVAYIGGVSRKAFARNFKNTDVMDIDRISVDIGNPLMSNLGGRYELVQQWMQYGVLRDPKKITEFLRTGQTDSLTEDDFKDTILIRSENEMLRKGQMPKAVIFDLHPEHINEHRRLANDPDIRSNPFIMQALLAHIQEHIALAKSVDPDLAAVLGLQPLPSQQMPAPSPDAQNGPPEVMNQNLPNLPPGTPPEAQQAYQQATNALPDINQSEDIQ